MAINKKNTEAKKTEAPETTYDVKVTRAKQFEDGNITFDLLVNGVAIYGCTYREYQNKGFTSFPSHKGKDGKYYNFAYFKISDEQQREIEEQIGKLI